MCEAGRRSDRLHESTRTAWAWASSYFSTGRPIMLRCKMHTCCRPLLHGIAYIVLVPRISWTSGMFACRLGHRGTFHKLRTSYFVPQSTFLRLKGGVGYLGVLRAISRRLISKIRFPHPISVADAIFGTRFDLRDSKRRALEN